MDWLVVILVVIALAMIGIVSLLHRGRVRLWSIAMILLGLGISIFLYTQIHIFHNWQSILYIVCSVALLLVLVYLGIVLRMRRLSVKDKQPEENDVLATASREPMRVSDWEAVIAYSAAPAKQKGIRRVTGKKAESSAGVPLTYAAFTPAEAPEQEQDEQKTLAADAIASFFRENTKLPQSSIKSASAFENEKTAERTPFPEPLRVKSLATKPAMDPLPVDDGSEFESLSFRVVRDKSAKTAVAAPVADPIPEHTAQVPKASVSAITEPAVDEHAAQAPKTSVIKETHEFSGAEAPLYKVYRPVASDADGKAVPVLEDSSERSDALIPGSAANIPSDVFVAETVQPEPDASIPYEEELPAAEEELLGDIRIEEELPAEEVVPFTQDGAVCGHLQPTAEIVLVDEPAAVLITEPTAMVEDVALEETEAVEPETAATADIIEAEDDLGEPASEEAIVEAEDAREAVLPETVEAKDVVAEAENIPEEACLPEEEALASDAVEQESPETGEIAALPEIPAPESDPEPDTTENPLPVPAEDPLRPAFAQGMAELNALVASRAYRSAQTLIFDLLRMAYTPTEEEKKKLLLIMKLLKEKETRTDADARTR